MSTSLGRSCDEKEIDIVTPYPKREPKPGDDMGLAQ